MSTTSCIGIVRKDDSVLSVYHHYDGYPEWLGCILYIYFDSLEKVEDLIAGGDLRCCWTHYRFCLNERNDNESHGHEYGPQYYSQLGENCPPRVDKSMAEFFAVNEEYAYLWTQDNVWVAWDLNCFDDDDPEIVQVPSEMPAELRDK
jgi:hypothetical protein